MLWIGWLCFGGNLDAQTAVAGPFSGRDVEIPDSGEVRAVAYRAGATGYLWSNGWHTHTVFVQDTGWYWVDVAVDSLIVRDSVHFLFGPRCFEIPNVLTPNGEIYDCIPLKSSCLIDTMHIRVFDRWGKEVYATSDQEECWNGEADGRFLPEGIYVYLLEWAIPDGMLRRRVGQITIVR